MQLWAFFVATMDSIPQKTKKHTVAFFLIFAIIAIMKSIAKFQFFGQLPN